MIAKHSLNGNVGHSTISLLVNHGTHSQTPDMSGGQQLTPFAGIVKKVVWTILSLASLAACCLHLWWIISGFISYDYTTNVDIMESRRLEFPGKGAYRIVTRYCQEL